MSERITDQVVKKLDVPPKGNRIVYDTEVKGFGARITAKGARSFILNYRNKRGSERRYTIGRFPDWGTTAARNRAKELKRAIDVGHDPLAERAGARDAPSVRDLCERFDEEHLPKLRKASQRDYRAVIKNNIEPALGKLPVAEVEFSDIDGLHRKITKTGATYQANRTVAILSKMFSLAIRWGWIERNPAKGIERNQESKRHRYLSGDEMLRLTKALDEHEDQQASNIFRMLLLTGARRGEVQSARWDQFDMEAGVWTKPGSTTKQKTVHRAPLSAPARQLLSEIRSMSDGNSAFVFPSGQNHRVEVKRNWAAICKAAEIEDIRIHDLRHSYASLLASGGASLPVIGALLGHSQPATTARYAHLMDDPLRAATESVGAIITGGESADIVPLRKNKK